MSAHSIPLPLTFLLLPTVRNRSRITRKCVRSAAQVARPSFLLFCFLSELQIIARFASIYFTSALTLVCLSPHLHFGAPSTLPEDSSFWAISEASWQTTPHRFCVFIYYALTRAFDRRNGSSIPLNFPPCFPFLCVLTLCGCLAYSIARLRLSSDKSREASEFTKKSLTR